MNGNGSGAMSLTFGPEWDESPGLVPGRDKDRLSVQGR